MARLSDIIENFIKEMINESEEQKVQIQRNELADQFRCAPSQINYVLTTRFTYAKGYVIESRRGGGGYIVIKQMIYNDSERRREIICEAIGNSITYHNALAVLQNLQDINLISIKEFEIMKMAINDRTLSAVIDRNATRAEILKAMIMCAIK